ncbi:MAG: chloride channel protein [Clostridia bacterium]|nr:chloride channel protein [Clostridia bacterium]
MTLTKKTKKEFKGYKTYVFNFLRLVFIGLLIGLICGVVGALFAKSINLATNLRGENGWLLYLLPIGGIIITALYKLCRVTGVGTNQVFESTKNNKPVSILLAPAVFLGTIVTHLLGGSAGREGAALQLGGSISTLLSKVLRLDEKTRHIVTLSSMGAFFSALFGTPLGAFVFAIEVVSVGSLCSAAFLPGIISSVTAYFVSTLLSVHPERFNLKAMPELELDIVWKVVIIAMLSAIVSIIFCRAMHITHSVFEKLIKNGYLRAITGGVIIVLLTLCFGTTDYNGGGIEVINRIFETGEVRYEAFLLKIIFTAITIGAGFKGGEIVPTFFIGATFGGAMATLIGLDPALGAAVGMAALFCGVTNCPISTIILAAELFSGNGILYTSLAAIISFVLSGYCSLYSGQKMVFSKTNEDVININAT